MRRYNRALFRSQKQPMSGGRRVLLATVICSLAAVAVALLSQYLFGMEPCAWCVLQRAQFLAIAFVCGLALMMRRPALQLLLSILALLLSLAGMAAALWQHFVANNAFSCSLTLADRIISGLALDRLMPAVLAPRAGCAEGAVDLLGIPYELWSLALFCIITAGLGVAIVEMRRSEASRI